MNIGVIGLGFMGAAHISAILDNPHASLFAVASQNPKAREGDLSETGGNLEVGQKKFDFSQVHKYDKWPDLIADNELDAVSICLPTYLHAEVGMAALASGKHVLCEKPMALSGTECDRMLEINRQSGKILMVAQVLRFWPEYLELADFVTAGNYGAVRQAVFTRKCGLPAWSRWLPNEALSGGALLDLLVHDIDQILYLFGMPQRVTAKRIGNSDSVMASFLYPGGPEVRLQGGWFEPEMPFSMSFQVRADRGEMSLQPDGLYVSDDKGNRQRLELPGSTAYAEEMSYFIDCCRTGEAPARCMPQESANAVKVALAIKESRARDGEQVSCLA